MKKRLFIIAGEASGDRHAADLVEELRQLHPEWEFRGIGGEAMRSVGVELRYHLSQLAVLGFSEIVRHLPFLRRVLKNVQEELRRETSAVILVDYPGFNLRVARMAKELNVPVIYYISPQLWAWGEKRVEKIRRYVDLMLVLFRFEETFYEKHGITAHFVGHPLVDQLEVDQPEGEFRSRNNLPIDKPLLGLFPGSREMEVRKLLPVMVRAVQQLSRELEIVAVIGRAPQLSPDLYRDSLNDADPGIRFVDNQTHALMRYSHAALVASGTATLELGYLETPMVVLYGVSSLTYWLGRMLIKIDTIGLANIVMGKKVVPELLQRDLTGEKVSAAVARYFRDADYYESVRRELCRIKSALGEEGASRRAAEKVSGFLSGRNVSQS